MSKKVCKVSQIIGPVVDVSFDTTNTELPKIYDSLEINKVFFFPISFENCLIAPYIMSKSNKNDIKDALHYGRNFGLLYQITDDILDFEGDLNKIGKTPKKDIKSWTSLTLKYLKGRPTLRTVCLLIDSRRGIGDLDKTIMKELDTAAVSWVLVLTKIDKLSEQEIIKVKDNSNKIISKYTAAFPEIMVTSSLKNNGIGTLRTYLASFA